MKSNIISNVSHELKTPIAIIGSILDLLADENEKHTKVELIEKARTALKNQTKIVDDLLEASRIGTKRYRLNIGKLDLTDIVVPVISEITPAAESRKITIKTQLGEPLPPIKASFCEFRHAFYNILENAVKFNETGGEVTVKASSDEEFVEISVEDTGIGISKEHLCRIFETFYQVDSSTTRKYDGTGMGLAVTKNIIEAHGGKITIDSNLVDGTTVTFNVPVFR